MLTFRELQNCEGYYYNVTTGEVLRNVGPGETRCWIGAAWDTTAATDGLDVAQFELLTPDVLMPLVTIERMVVERYGRPAPDHLLNRQTALQPDQRLLTEETPSHLTGSNES